MGLVIDIVIFHWYVWYTPGAIVGGVWYGYEVGRITAEDRRTPAKHISSRAAFVSGLFVVVLDLVWFISIPWIFMGDALSRRRDKRKQRKYQGRPVKDTHAI